MNFEDIIIVPYNVAVRCSYPCNYDGWATIYDNNQTPEEALKDKVCERCGRTGTLHKTPYHRPD